MNQQIEDYILDHLGAENSVLHELFRQTNLKIPHPGMISGHEQGRLLSMISNLARPERILEIGTYTGYSAICLAEGLREGGQLHTVEINDELAEIARHFVKKAGFDDKITLHIGDAIEILPQISGDFDLVFIDAAKRRYQCLYNAVFDRVKRGGCIIIDNILWYGRVADHRINDETTVALRDFNSFLRNDTRVERAIIKNRDGLFILRKK